MINMLSAASGGGMTYARAIVPLLQQHLPDSLVLAGTSLSASRSKATNTLKVSGYWTCGARRFAWEAANLGKVIKRYGIRTLYTPYQVATQPRGVKSVCALRNMEPFFARRYPYSAMSRLRNELLRWLSREHLNRADLVIAVSQFANDFARDSLGVPKERLVTIYHGRDESLVGDECEIDRIARQRAGIDGPYILTAGSLLPYRRVEDVIAAFDRLTTQVSSRVLLVIAGTGSDPSYRGKLEEQVAASRYREGIRFLGYVDGPTMRALYKGCQAFVSASEIEACPNIGIEAMTAGCAVIASDAGPAREIYGDGAAFYEPRNVECLGSLLLNLAGDAEESASLRARARRRSSAFSWQNCAIQTAHVLKAL